MNEPLPKIGMMSYVPLSNNERDLVRITTPRNQQRESFKIVEQYVQGSDKNKAHQEWQAYLNQPEMRIRTAQQLNRGMNRTVSATGEQKQQWVEEHDKKT
eukprot:1867752-Rhodomonas_salina.1